MINASQRALLVTAALASAAAPFISASQSAPNKAPFPGWPAAHEGRPLTPLPLTSANNPSPKASPARLPASPTATAKLFSAMSPSATRRLHPASDCYKGLGFEIKPLPLRRDANGQHFGCFSARKGETRHTVCEGLRDANGGAWSDVSQWYWEALLGRTAGPWWSIVIAETLNEISDRS